MKQVLLSCVIIWTLLISGCQTAKVMAEYGDNIAFVEASELDKSGNREEAFNKYLSIANNDSYSGAQSAQYRVAQGYLKGDGVHKNLSLAIEWFQRTAKGPDLTWSNHANYALGNIYDVNSEYSAEVNTIKAHEYYSKCADTGDKYCESAKKSLERYPEVYINTNKHFFYDSSDKVAPYGMNIGYRHFKEGNHEEAFKVFLFHAMKGNVSAQENIAVYYRTGDGVPKDEQKYISWLYLAAKNGSDISQFELGGKFRLGKLVPGSDVEAMKWFTHASSQGHAAAYNSIGIIFAHPFNSGIKPDYKKSFDFFTQASNLGLPNADVNLGDSYLAGLGAEKNKSIAKEYYLKAAQNGSMNAKKKLLEHFDYSYTSKTFMEKQGDSSAKFKPNDKVAESNIEKRTINAKEKDTRKSQKTPVQLFSDLNLSVYKILALNGKQLIDNKKDARISQGSAVALSDRIAITNCHVLEGMNYFGAIVNDEVVRFELAAKDKKKDLCVIRSSSPLTFVQLTKDYSRIKVGERVYAIGSPSGFQNTLSEGIVSGLREIRGFQHIQTTTPISPGSSGGGLFDAEGKLIGITTFGVGDKGNLNFAVSLDEAFPLLEAVK